MYEDGEPFERHVVVRFLGKGAFGSVYLARHKETQRLEAVKVLDARHADDPVFVERFKRESQHQARIKSAYVVQVFDAGGGSEGIPNWIAMEYLDGGSLEDRLRNLPIPSSLAAQVGRSIGSVLGVAHTQGILHRDVKPANILLSTDGEMKLSDFGIAFARGRTALTDLGSSLGTWEYCAPEQLAGKASAQEKDKTVANAADTYALGSVLYELLTGKTPFGHIDTRDRLYGAVVYDSPQTPSVKAGSKVKVFDDLILRALDKNPKKRPTPRELGTNFATILETSGLTTLPLPARPVPPPPPPRNWPSFRSVIAGFTVVVCIAVGVLTPARDVFSSLGALFPGDESGVKADSDQPKPEPTAQSSSTESPKPAPPKALKNNTERTLAAFAKSTGEINYGCESDPQVPSKASARIRCQAGAIRGSDESGGLVSQTVLDDNKGNPDSFRFSYMKFDADKDADDYFEGRRSAASGLAARSGECDGTYTWGGSNKYAFCRIGDRAYVWWTYQGQQIAAQGDAPVDRAQDLYRTWRFRHMAGD